METTNIDIFCRNHDDFDSKDSSFRYSYVCFDCNQEGELGCIRCFHVHDKSHNSWEYVYQAGMLIEINAL